MVDPLATANGSSERGRIPQIATDDSDANGLQPASITVVPHQRPDRVSLTDQSLCDVAADESRGSGHEDARHAGYRAPACCRSFSVVWRSRSSSNVIRFCEESPFPAI